MPTLKDAPKGDFVFYETAPPTANGMPGLGRVEPRVV